MLLFVCAGASLADEPYRVFDLRLEGVESGRVTRVHGAVGDGTRGAPLTGGVDIDGDGFADMALASMLSSPLGRSGAGEVMLFFGDGTIGGAVDTTGFSERWLKFAGGGVNEVAGAEVWMDDVTGDGIGDLLIGRQNYTSPEGTAGAGGLSIVVGSAALKMEAANLQYIDLLNPPGQIKITTIHGENPYDRFGIWTRTGDVDGDGVLDLVVGADEVDGGGETNRGAIYVIRGGEHLANGEIFDLANLESTALEGHVTRIDPPPGAGGYHFGATVQVADLDGNGRVEVMACAALNRAGAGIRLPDAPAGTGEPVGGSTSGSLFIVWDDNFPAVGMPMNGQLSFDSLPAGSTTRIDGGESNLKFAEEMLGDFDADGDGNSELLTGDLAGQGNGGSSGLGHVFWNAANLKGRIFDVDAVQEEGLEVTVIRGPRAGSIGTDSVTSGDFDGDGYDDLASGNPHDFSPARLPDETGERISSGSVHVLYGHPDGWPAEIDLAVGQMPPSTTLRVVRIDGALGAAGVNDKGDTLSYSIDSGDIDGDGTPDIIVNEMTGNGFREGQLDVGNLLVISGKALLNPLPLVEQVERLEGNPASVRVHFQAFEGLTYRLQHLPDLSNPAWMDSGSELVGDGLKAMLSYEIPPGEEQGYFRLTSDEPVQP